MTTKKIHYLSGMAITTFIALHLFNHVYSIFGKEWHIEMMTTLRLVYRNVFIETILLVAVCVQIFSGIKLFRAHLKTSFSFFERLHIWSGLYLAVFLIIHVSAVFTGRLVLKLDTNFYFGVAGLNSFPHLLFFAPYYGLALVSFFGHIAAIHDKKSKIIFFGLTPFLQSWIILMAGVIFTILVFYGLTDHFRGVKIPKEYQVLVGK